MGRLVAALTHALGLLIGLIAPLLLFIVYTFIRDDLVRRNAWQATKWQFMIAIYALITAVIFNYFMPLGILLAIIIVVLDVYHSVKGTGEAYNGRVYEYPYTP